MAKRQHRLLRPRCRMVEAGEVGRRIEHGRRIDAIKRTELSIATGHELVAPAEAEAGHPDPLLQVLAVVPGLEMCAALRRAIVEDGENACHGAIPSLRRGPGLCQTPYG